MLRSFAGEVLALLELVMADDLTANRRAGARRCQQHARSSDTFGSAGVTEMKRPMQKFVWGGTLTVALQPAISVRTSGE